METINNVDLVVIGGAEGAIFPECVLNYHFKGRKIN